MSAPSGARARVILSIAAIGVALAAADTYVVVLALTDMMAGVGITIDALQQAIHARRPGQGRQAIE